MSSVDITRQSNFSKEENHLSKHLFIRILSFKNESACNDFISSSSNDNTRVTNPKLKFSSAENLLCASRSRYNSFYVHVVHHVQHKNNVVKNEIRNELNL